MRKEYVIKSRGLFKPKSDKPFKISRSQIEAFVQCPKCFYLNHRHGIRHVSMPPWSINSLVDKLLKCEFDLHREAGTAHPIMIENNVDAIPFNHLMMDDWRNPFSGVRHLHEETNLLVSGGIDDLWQKPNGEIVVVDYKATATSKVITMDDEWKDSYKRQMEIYQWLVRQQNLEVSDTGYFLYCNGRNISVFDRKVNFEVTLLPYIGKCEWIDLTLYEIKECLMSDKTPEAPHDCEHCGYVVARNAA